MLDAIASTVETLLQPIPVLEWNALDLYGAYRLSQIIVWVGTGAIGGKRSDATVSQQLFGLMVVVLGPETFLALCNGTAPPWLVSSSVAALFCTAHIINSLIARVYPTRPSFNTELLLAVPDAINRCLLVTRFSRVDGTLVTRLLVPFINAVPFAALSFGGFNYFADMHLSTPVELAPWGWAMVDAWIPFITVAYQAMQGMVPGVEMAWSEEHALAACMLFTVGVFIARLVYNR